MKDIVVSQRISLPGRPVEGSVQSPCVDCGHPIWLSPVSQARVESGLKAYCVECSTIRMLLAVAEGETPIFMMPWEKGDQ